jgi:hypothetical protein
MGKLINLVIIIWIAFTLNACTNKRDNVSYPQIFRAWSGIESIPGEDDITNYAWHDLCFGSINSLLKLDWQVDDNNKYRGLSTQINPDNLPGAITRKEKILKQNPNIKLLAVIGYRDGFYASSKSKMQMEFPSDSPFWLKDKNNNRVVGWAEDTNVDGVIDLKDDTPWVLVDFTKEELQDILAAKALAIKNTGLIDGIFLDWWKEAYATSDNILEPGWNPVLSHETEVNARINILKKIRAKVGDDFLILVNSNYDTIPLSAPYVNGVFMECYKDYDKDYTIKQIKTIENSLSWLEKNLKEPRINCLEGWRVVNNYNNDPATRITERNSEENKQCMRMITTLSLTHSDGYVLFGDPNQLPCNDHLHNWYDFWDAKIGNPVSGKAISYNNIKGLFIREFDNGWVVYNNSGSSQRISFTISTTGVNSHITEFNHTISDLDGEIYLYH